MENKVGIIDIGSNTMRLVIYAQPQKGLPFKEIQNIKMGIRLRTYLNTEKIVSDEGISKLIDTLHSFQLLLHHYDVTNVTCIATATIRQAKNREDVIHIVQEKTGFTLTLLNEYEEAFYGYTAVIHSTDIKEGITVDMGGGSTEITYFQNRELVEYCSLPFGSLSLRLDFVKGSIPTEEEYEQIRQYVQAQLEDIPWIANKKVPLIGIGGSARNFGQLHQHLIDYPLAGIHQYEMNVSTVQEVQDNLKTFTFSELQKLEGLSKERADTILPSLEVFRLLLNWSNSSKFIISKKGLREGILYNKIEEQDYSSRKLVNMSMQDIMYDFRINMDNSRQIFKIAKSILKQVNKIKEMDGLITDKDVKLLEHAACIFHLGKYLNEESSSHHTFYLLSNRSILGLSHQERVKLALIASYKGKRTFRQYIESFKDWYTQDEQKKMCLLGSILKVAQSLNITKRNVVTDIKFSSKNGDWIMDIQCHDDYKPEEYRTEKQKKHLEKSLKVSLIPNFHY
ncbi:Ppx/GppA family phosphatase [Priestia megaterium]|uniref:Ppx/GppA family phosphatase n=1 Tax=Priestia megaterium TaxID=1404 RepID=UPI00203B033A|nr:Ppx/GppA family phosphatase [Priestia megaterium]MCM3196588.1 Ppx/GppA family phosphatase [Priestia megaterium]